MDIYAQRAVLTMMTTVTYPGMMVRMASAPMFTA